jgi:hypothetical protein
VLIELRPLIFIVIIEESVFVTAIVLSIFDVFVCVMVILCSMIMALLVFLLQIFGYTHSSLQPNIWLPVFSLGLGIGYIYIYIYIHIHIYTYIHTHTHFLPITDRILIDDSELRLLCYWLWESG